MSDLEIETEGAGKRITVDLNLLGINKATVAEEISARIVTAIIVLRHL